MTEQRKKRKPNTTAADTWLLLRETNPVEAFRLLPKLDRIIWRNVYADNRIIQRWVNDFSCHSKRIQSAAQQAAKTIFAKDEDLLELLRAYPNSADIFALVRTVLEIRPIVGNNTLGILMSSCTYNSGLTKNLSELLKLAEPDDLSQLETLLLPHLLSHDWNVREAAAGMASRYPEVAMSLTDALMKELQNSQVAVHAGESLSLFSHELLEPWKNDLFSWALGENPKTANAANIVLGKLCPAEAEAFFIDLLNSEEELIRVRAIFGAARQQIWGRPKRDLPPQNLLLSILDIIYDERLSERVRSAAGNALQIIGMSTSFAFNVSQDW